MKHTWTRGYGARKTLSWVGIGLAFLATAPDTSAQASEEDPLAAAEGLGWAVGETDAPITVVEFTDISCPYCARFHEGTRQALIDEFVDGGQVRWITLTYVSGIYPNSDALTLAAECAGQQGHYEAFLTEAYAARERWVTATDPVAMAEARRYADSLGMNLDAFEVCRSDTRVVERAMAVMTLAKEAGVRGTPTWFVDGFPVMGALPHGYARSFIASQLPG
ncbi:MAG: thioredoxin domain-containing protein [Gemmatimonadota bacterium]